LYPTGFTPSGVQATGLKIFRLASESNYAYITYFHFG